MLLPIGCQILNVNFYSTYYMYFAWIRKSFMTGNAGTLPIRPQGTCRFNIFPCQVDVNWDFVVHLCTFYALYVVCTCDVLLRCCDCHRYHGRCSWWVLQIWDCSQCGDPKTCRGNWSTRSWEGTLEECVWDCGLSMQCSSIDSLLYM